MKFPSEVSAVNFQIETSYQAKHSLLKHERLCLIVFIVLTGCEAKVPAYQGLSGEASVLWLPQSVTLSDVKGESLELESADVANRIIGTQHRNGRRKKM